MNSDKQILIGLPGSGKSTIGPEIAKRLNLKFYDLDDYIDISKKDFRQIELLVLKRLLKKESFLIAVGGGAILNKEIRALINKYQKIIIKVDLDICFKRIQGTKRLYKNHEDLILRRNLIQKYYVNEIHKICT